MSLVDVQGVNLVPGIMARSSLNPFQSPTLLDANGELCGAVLRIPKTGNISKIGFRTGTATVSDAIKVSLQTVDEATGRPTGTLIHADAYGVQASVASNTTYWVSLQDDIAVTRGVRVAPVIEFNSFVAGNLNILKETSGFSSYGFPYSFKYIGSVWSFSGNASNFGLEYDDGVIEPITGLFPAVAGVTISWDTNDNPDRRGLRFSLPYNYRVSGVFGVIGLDGDADIEIYDSDGITIIPDGTISLDKDIRGRTNRACFVEPLKTPIELTKDTFYRIAIHPTTGTTIVIYALDVTDDGANEAMNAIDGGVNFHYTTCDSVPAAEGDWTNLLTRRPLIGLIIDQLDDGLPYNVVGGAEIVGQSTAGTVEGD